MPGKSGERSRFDAAHELGHLVLHRHGQIHGRDVEHEADRFASAFLMPAESVRAVAPKFITLETIVKMKVQWNVSVSALNHRLHALKIISDWHYRQLCIQISEKGWRKKEPNGSLHEGSKVLEIVMSEMHKSGVGRAQIAQDLYLYPDYLNSFMFGLALSSLSGQGTKSKSRAQLSLVEGP